MSTASATPLACLAHAGVDPSWPPHDVAVPLYDSQTDIGRHLKTRFVGAEAWLLQLSGSHPAAMLQAPVHAATVAFNLHVRFCAFLAAEHLMC